MKENKSINPKFVLALISSPIFAVYGLLPVYLFKTVEFASIFKGFTFLTSVFVIIWFINLFLLRQLRNELGIKFFTISYLFVLSFVSIAIHFAKGFLKTPELDINLIYPLFSVLVINSIILLLINTIEINAKRKQEILENEKIKALQLETQHRLLLNHLQPHVLFNMLSTLKSIINNNPTEAADFTVKLSNFLRNSLQNDTSGLHSIEHELIIVEDYLHLQKSRFGNSFVYNINIPNNFLKYQIASLSIQTLVENAFKHNLFSTYQPLQISISIAKESLLVKNTYAPNDNETDIGTGLINLNERTEILMHKAIEVSKTDKHFEVVVPIKHII
jgi:two-component system, LytTR family, sensor kinase